MTIKEQMMKVIQQLPEDATIEEAIDQLYLWLKIQKAEAQVHSGQVVSHEEARKRIAQWLGLSMERRRHRLIPIPHDHATYLLGRTWVFALPRADTSSS